MEQIQPNIIEGLISLKQEGGYWDFKREWHKNNNDLLHDIICMANNLINRDTYIIIDVDENADCSVCDVSSDPNRKTTQNITDFLKDKRFAGDFRPMVKVETLSISDTTLDIIVIENSNMTPFFLSADYQGVHANNIYTQVQDTNTPINASANYHHIEYLWRKRFGFHKTIMERLMIVLDDFDNWVYQSDLPHYHKLFPEFHIEYEDIDGNDDISRERYCGFYINEKGSQHRYKIYYHSTVLFNSIYLYLDEARVIVSNPSNECFCADNQELRYYYFTKDTIDGKMLRLFTNNTFDTTSRGTGVGAFLIFESKIKRKEFECFVINNINEYLSSDIDFAERAIQYELKNDWMIKSCESMARLYKMSLLWQKEVTP
jgi:hypothetical protein